jgi:hypothetical protein
MQNLQEIQEKIFFECKNILETLAKINSKDELLAKQDLFSEITDRIAFLRILEKNVNSFISNESMQISENQSLKLNFDNDSISNSDDYPEEVIFDDTMEEEVIFTNELNEIKNEAEEKEPVSKIYENENLTDVENISAKIHTSNEVFKEKNIFENEQEQKANYQESIAQKEKEFQELEERRRKIVEFNKEDAADQQKEEIFNNSKSQYISVEKKFKLAGIKGLKQIQNIFDGDHLEKLHEEVDLQRSSDSGNILRTNIPTDFMESEKKKHEFKLDLNDEVAFAEKLFHGDEEDLKNTIDKLNSFNELEDVRQYLSEVYHKKDWEKVDEYAQRLWNLVESKFF